MHNVVDPFISCMHAPLNRLGNRGWGQGYLPTRAVMIKLGQARCIHKSEKAFLSLCNSSSYSHGRAVKPHMYTPSSWTLILSMIVIHLLGAVHRSLFMRSKENSVQCNLDYPDLVYPDPRLSGLAGDQKVHHHACAEGVASDILWVWSQAERWATDSADLPWAKLAY